MTSDFHKRVPQQDTSIPADSAGSPAEAPGIARIQVGSTSIRGYPAGRPRGSTRQQADPLTRAVQGVLSLVSLAEFEILFVAFFIIVFLWLKDFLSHPDYNQILVNNPWPTKPTDQGTPGTTA